MKSVLQEASSVEKAIAQAWLTAGMPQDFSVCVLEPGERGFLGFTKKYAVISLTYTGGNEKPGLNQSQRGGKPQQTQSQSRKPQQSVQVSNKAIVSKEAPKEIPKEKKPQLRKEAVLRPLVHKDAVVKKESAPKIEKTEKSEVVAQSKVVQPKVAQPKVLAPAENVWTDEYIADAQAWLSEIIGILSPGVSLQAEPAGVILNVIFSKKLLEDSDNEQTRSICLAALLAPPR